MKNSGGSESGRNERNERNERIALIKEIKRRIRELDTEQLRRVDWYIDRIDR